MAESAIEWTDVVWNPTTGCDRISPGCDNCYALTMAKRLKGMGAVKYQNDGDPRTSGPGFGLTVHPDTLTIPLHWREPRRVFVDSMSDLFHARVPREFIAKVFATMAATPQHTYQILTKRPERMARLIGFDGLALLEASTDDTTAELLYEQWPLPNVWLGTSIESDRYVQRADDLRDTPAAVRFISAEPLLGPLPSLDLTGIGWVIVGGESGAKARPMHPAWVRSLRDQCNSVGVPFFFKQWGSWRPTGQYDWRVDGRCQVIDPDGTLAGVPFANASSMVGKTAMTRMAKHQAGRELDGRIWDEYPQAVAA